MAETWLDKGIVFVGKAHVVPIIWVGKKVGNFIAPGATTTTVTDPKIPPKKAAKKPAQKVFTPLESDILTALTSPEAKKHKEQVRAQASAVSAAINAASAQKLADYESAERLKKIAGGIVAILIIKKSRGK